jgi:hypothetical protein
VVPFEKPTLPMIPGGDASDSDAARESHAREMAQSDRQRQQSGGLDDDPTASGNPVRNRHSFTITKTK